MIENKVNTYIHFSLLLYFTLCVYDFLSIFRIHRLSTSNRCKINQFRIILTMSKEAQKAFVSKNLKRNKLKKSRKQFATV